MKMIKNKNNKIYNLVLVLLVLFSVFAVTNCKWIELLEINHPEGMGALSLSIAGEGAQGRAILPRPEENKSFSSYKLEFFTGGSKEHEIETADLTSIFVPAGIYIVEVTAYTDSNYTEPAAKGTISSITILPNAVTSEVIVLYPIQNGFGSGTFKWNISFETIDWAYMEITNQTGTDAYSETYILAGSPPEATGTPVGRADSLSIPAGDYRIVFTLKKDNTTREIKWRETLHIYQNLISEYEYQFTNAHFALNVYTAVIDRNNGTSPTEQSYRHGDLFVNPGTPVPNGLYRFGGWYTTGNFAAGSEWTFTEGMQVTSNFALYAKWDTYPILNPTNVEFHMVYGHHLPERIISVRNDGLGDATGINIVLADTANFELIYTSGSISTINPNSSVSFSIKPRTALPVGEYTTAITISCAGEPDTVINVKFIVDSAYKGTFTADNSFNSNDLITVDNPEHGWWSKTVEGTWKRGIMITAGENTNLDIQLIDVPFRFNELGNYFNTTWIPLAGGVGRWRGQQTGSGNSVRARVFVEIYIPYDDMEVWIESTNGGAVGATSYPETDGTSNTGWVSLQNGNYDYVLRFRLNARASYTYQEDLFWEYAYPIFESGGVYYWRENNEDHWNIFGEEIKILEFNAGVHNSDGTIKIRAYDTGAEGVTFYYDPEGTDIQFPPITSANYSAPIMLPIFVLGEEVGYVSVRMTGHAATNTNIITRVNVEVVYNLDPEFADHVVSYTCNGFPVGSNNTITLTGLNHGPLMLHTEFNFE